jgi:parallel beta-helix repeat protein
MVIRKSAACTAVFLFLLGLATGAFGDTVVPAGNVSGTWSASGSPYVVNGDITVAKETSLAIDPGVTVKFAAGAEIRIYGTFTAAGTQSMNVRFTTAQPAAKPGDWYGLIFYQGCNARLDWSVVEWAQTGLVIYSSNPKIYDCSVRLNSLQGILVSASAVGCTSNSARPEIYRTLVYENVGYGIQFVGSGNSMSGCIPSSSGYAAGVLSGCDVYDNGRSGILLTANSGYYSSGSASPEISNCHIYGNSEHGILMEGSSQVSPKIQNCEVYENTGSGIRITSVNGSPTLLADIVRENGGAGIYNKSPYLSVEKCEITRNDSNGVETAALRAFMRNDLYENTGYDFYYTGTTDQLATFNYWGTTSSAAIAARVYDVFDNSSVGKVIYEPFMSGSAQIPDTAPPSVVATAPADGGTQVDPKSTVAVTFSEPMNRSTFSSNSITLNDFFHPLNVSFNADLTTVIFTFVAPLQEGTRYNARLRSLGVQDLSGNALPADFLWSFATSGSPGPLVVATDPADSATGVDVDTAITVSFSKSMNPGTITASNFLLNGDTVTGTVSFNDGVTAATLRPASKLALNKVYSVRFKSANVTDASGRLLPRDAQWTFTTQAFEPPSDDPGSSFRCSPNNGTVGTESRVTGTSMGSTPGKILVGGVKCQVLNWSGTSAGFLLKKPISPGIYDLTVMPKEPKGSPPVVLSNAYTVKGPEISSLSRSGGSPGDTITISGLYFGTKPGKVYLVDYAGRRTKCKLAGWSMDPATNQSTGVFIVSSKLPGGSAVLVENKIGSANAAFSVY